VSGCKGRGMGKEAKSLPASQFVREEVKGVKVLQVLHRL